MEPSIEAKLQAIEQRLARVERNLNISVQPAPQQPVPQSSASWVPPPNIPRINPVAPRIPYSETSSGNWLGYIAILCFVLAAGFIIKLSIESGWLTPEKQICIAALLGFGLIIAGFVFMKSDREYASFLPAGGVIVLYLTAFAAHRLYSLVSYETALVLIGMISILCVWLYKQIEHDIFAITGAAGAYLAPVVLGMNAGASFSLYYFLICSGAFATISIGVQSRIFTLLSAYLAILMTGLIGLDLGKDVMVAVTLALHFFIFAISTYLYTARNQQPLTDMEANSFLPILLIFYAMEYFFLNRISPAFAPWISLAFAGALIGLYIAARKNFPDGLASQSVILAFATIVSFHSIYLEILPDDLRPWLFPLILLCGTLLPARILASNSANTYPIPKLALLAILAIEYMRMVSHLVDGHGGYWLGMTFIFLASIWFVLTVTDQDTLAKKTYGNGLLTAAHLLAILGLFRLANDFGSLAVSACWLLYATGVMVYAFKLKDEIMAKSALFVLALAAGKALLVDAASAPTIVRILCLLLTGGVLYGCGLLMRKFSDWSARQE